MTLPIEIIVGSKAKSLTKHGHQCLDGNLARINITFDTRG